MSTTFFILHVVIHIWQTTISYNTFRILVPGKFLCTQAVDQCRVENKPIFLLRHSERSWWRSNTSICYIKWCKNLPPAWQASDMAEDYVATSWLLLYCRNSNPKSFCHLPPQFWRSVPTALGDKLLSTKHEGDTIQFIVMWYTHRYIWDHVSFSLRTCVSLHVKYTIQ